MANLHHALILGLGHLDHLALAFEVDLEVLHAVAERGGSGAFSPGLIPELVEGRIKYQAKVFLIIYLAVLARWCSSSCPAVIVRGTLLNVAVPELYLLIRD